MTGTRRRLLVLAPDAGDDAPAAEALRLVEHLSSREDVEWRALLGRGGPRLDEFEATGRVVCLGERPPSGLTGLAERLLFRLGIASGWAGLRRRRLGLYPWRQARPTAVFLTSPRSAPLLRALPVDRTPVWVMVGAGELAENDPDFLRPDDERLLRSRADRWVVSAVDEGPRKRLDQWGVPASAVEWYGDPSEDRSAGASAERDAWRDRLGVGAGQLVVAGSGPTGWEGGTDIFLRTVWTLRERLAQDVAAVWVGPSAGEQEAAQLAYDVEHMGLGGHLHLLGPDAEGALAVADVHLVTSRKADDRHAHVPAASRGVPFVAFATEALERFAADGAGVLVEFLDVPAMAVAARDLLADPAERRRVAEAVRRRYGGWHVPAERPAYLVDRMLVPS